VNPPKNCAACGGENVSREVHLQDEENSWLELKRVCGDCGHEWIEAHQNGRFIGVVSRDGVREKTTARLTCAPKVCPLCLKGIGKHPIASYSGMIGVGNTNVKFRCDVHKHCLERFKYWDQVAADATLKRDIESLIASEARKHQKFKP
jgi:hypothetical protein